MKRNLKKIIISATAILILTGCNVEQTFNDTIDGAGRVFNSENNDKSTQRDVYEDAKEIIRRNLSSPSSAIFPTFSSEDVTVIATKTSSDAYVTGHVDADNAMGTSIRSYYTVHIIYEEYAGIGAYTYEIQELG